MLPTPRQKRASEHGFTLLELMIAITLLVMIVAIMMGALRLASRSVEAGERKTENQERLRAAATFMDAQIQSQLPLTSGTEQGKSYYFRGDNKTLRMATGYSIWGAGKGSVIVDYRVEAGDGGRQTLYASEQTPGIEARREARLFTDASEISFEYYTKDPADEAGQWSEQWTGGTTLPGAIRLHVGYGAQKLVFLFPLRTRGEMAQVPMRPPVPNQQP